MRILRLIMLAIATALFAINFWTIDYNAPVSTVSFWAYFRIVTLAVIMVLLVSILRKNNKGGVPVKSRTGLKHEGEKDA